MAKKLAATPGTTAAQRERLDEEHEYFLNRARNYVNMFDPADRLLPGPRRGREVQVAPRTTTTRWSGARARLHRDQRLELRVPRPAGRPGPGQPVRRPRRAWPTSSTSSSRPRRRPSSPAPTAGSSTRCSRRATCAWASGASATRSRTTSRTCTTTPASRPRRRRRCARCCAGCTSARRSARATRVTRTTARCPRGTCSARSASTRCRSAARLRDRLAAVHQGDGPPGQRARHRHQRAGQQRAQRLRAGL